jgi:hypothetical protein
MLGEVGMEGLGLIGPEVLGRVSVRIQRGTEDESLPFCRLDMIYGVRPASRGWYIYECIGIKVGSPL